MCGVSVHRFEKQQKLIFTSFFFICFLLGLVSPVNTASSSNAADSTSNYLLQDVMTFCQHFSVTVRKVGYSGNEGHSDH